MTGKPAATDCNHPRYPEYRDEFGEDPARVIYHMDPVPRIRAIDDPDYIRAYLDVETDRENPRQDVIAACNQKLQASNSPTASAANPAVADGGEPQ